MSMKFKLIFLILISWLIRGRASLAQDIRYGAGLDSAYMLIGDHRHLSFQIEADKGTKMEFPVLSDTIVKGIEIIAGPIRDSIKIKGKRWTYSETYIITSFDTGVYRIPSYPIMVEQKGYNSTFRTDPIDLSVTTVRVDDKADFKDIIDTKSVPLKFWDVFKWILLGILIIGLVFIALWYWKKRKSGQGLFSGSAPPSIPPYEKAINLLTTLKTTKAWQKDGEEKQYYTTITDAIRRYVDGEIGIEAMEQTSYEIIKEMKKSEYVNSDDIIKIQELLETADFVKFAKYVPLHEQGSKYLEDAILFIENTHANFEKEIAKEDDNLNKGNDK